jgi:hypothetical protein
MTTTSARPAGALCEELAAAPRAEVITSGDPGDEQAPQSLGQRC